MVEPLQAAHDHERAWLRRQATTVTPVRVGGQRVGEVVRTGTVPRIRDHNALVLEACPHLDGPAVHDLLERELGALGHRRLYCAPEDADRWHDALVGRGHERADTVVMTWSGGRLPAPTTDVRLVEADRHTATAAVGHVLAAEHGEGSPVVEQLVALAGAQHDLGVRVFVARRRGHPVGAVRVFPGDDVAQVEELQVLPSARGRGVGRVLLAGALASVADVPMVFLTSDPDDWPTRWYERLGFEVRGRSSGFVREAVESGT